MYFGYYPPRSLTNPMAHFYATGIFFFFSANSRCARSGWNEKRAEKRHPLKL
jgi:hypothetical protein